MVHKITKAIVLWQIDRGILPSEEYDTYQYAYEIFFWQSVNLLLSLMIAAAFGELAAVTCFLLYFITLRKYAGGYHAKNYISCTMISAAETALFCIAFSCAGTGSLAVIYEVLDKTAVILIWCLSPIDHENKCLNDNQICLFRRKSRFLLITGVLFELLFFLTGLPYDRSIKFSHIFLAVSLICGKLKKRR